MENNLIVKPTFNGEIEVKIKSLGEIESNMQEVKTFAENLNEYYSKIIFDEDSLKKAKEEKANVNKFKNKISDYRKNIVKQWKEPINQFENMAKTTEQLLDKTYQTINEQCNKYDEEKKKKKENDLKDFFNEYVKSNNIDFIEFKDVGLNITISASEKSLKEQIISFISKIKQDLQVIDSQEFKTEILVEYKQNLDLNKSILLVNERKKRLQLEKEKQEKLIQERLEAEQKATAEALQNYFIPKDKIVFVNKGNEEENYAKQVKEEEEEIIAPTNITEQEKKYTLNFKVTGTMEELKALKEYMKNNNLEVE